MPAGWAHKRLAFQIIEARQPVVHHAADAPPTFGASQGGGTAASAQRLHGWRRSVEQMRITALHLALPVLAVAVLAGCASGGTPTADPTATATASPTTSAPAPSATPAPDGGQVDPNAPEGQCADANLTATVTPDPGGAGAGSITSVITFTNSGPECVLEGAPGVSIRGDGDGVQIGEPAEQQGTPAPVTLAQGGTAVAPLTSVNIGTDGGPLGADCEFTTGDGYRVYPPHSFEPIFIQSAGVPACTSTSIFMHVGVVTAS